FSSSMAGISTVTRALLVVAALGPCRRACSQEAAGPASPPVVVDSFTKADRVWISGQANLIGQLQPSFDAKYSGPNSLLAGEERASSLVMTAYGGARWTRRLEVLFNVESVAGNGLTLAHGLGGVTNFDAAPDGAYVARAMVHYTIPLGTGMVLVT